MSGLARIQSNQPQSTALAEADLSCVRYFQKTWQDGVATFYLYFNADMKKTLTAFLAENDIGYYGAYFNVLRLNAEPSEEVRARFTQLAAQEEVDGFLESVRAR